MHFNQITGQTAAKARLVQMVANDRMPHALLFLGAEGCGKLALALAMAQYILCNDKQGGDSCGRCSQCIKAAKYIHPDLHFSYPVVGTKVTSDSYAAEWRKALEQNPYLNVNQWLQSIGAENKQGNINKDECNAIIKKLSLKIYEGSHKILIMWLPEYLQKEGNRLLKLIEEPPENTVFILVAEQSEKILNTILSRCQIVNIHPLSDAEVERGLIQKGVPAEKARQVAFLANGNLNAGLQLAESADNDNADLFLEWMRICWKGHGLDMVTWVNEKFATLGRENQKHFMAYALHFMREYTLLKMTGTERLRLQPKEAETAKKFTKIIEFPQIEPIVELLTNSSYYIERNANPKVLFLDASIRMHRILKNG